MLSRGFCSFDSGHVWQLFHLSPKYPRIIMSSVRLLNQIKKSTRQNLRFALLLRCKHITSLKNHLSLAKRVSLPYWFGATSVSLFVLIYWLRGFSLYKNTNRFVAIVFQNPSSFCCTHSKSHHISSKCIKNTD